MKESFFYKIKNNKTGFYRLAGGYEKWSKQGKVWKNLQALKLHFSLYDQYPHKDKNTLLDKDWTIEKYSTIPVESIPIKDFLTQGNPIG